MSNKLHYIPSPKNDKEKFDITLEGQQFTIEYAYNPRDGFWYLKLIKDNEAVLDYMRLTMGYYFGYNYNDFPLTQGELKLYSPQGYGDDAFKSNFGKTVFLVYEEAGDE